MTYCRCYSCKYLLRFVLKTECGQFLPFLTDVFWVNNSHRDFPSERGDEATLNEEHGEFSTQLKAPSL